MKTINKKPRIEVMIMTLIFLTLSSLGLTAELKKVPEVFRGQDNQSKIEINYDDLSEILKLSVLDMGMSTRTRARKTTAKIGTRFKSKRKSYTAFEANRFLFENFDTANNKLVLTAIRESLERVPDEVPMSMLNAKEQLAFWLNLYNVSLLEQLVAVYPKRNIEDLLYDNGIMDSKILEVSGMKLSLNDIHQNIILGKFSTSPVVIYGLFQGTIGGPNIRTKAYTGKSVIKDLQNNATEFINSNRGTFEDKKGSLRVSSFYDTNRHLFPDFNKDLKKHLSLYINDKYAKHLQQAKRFKTTIKDMNIVSMSGGEREFSSSAATNQAAFLASSGRPEVTGVQTHFDGVEFTTENVGNLAGGGPGNAGFINPAASITEEGYSALTANFGRYSAQQMELLKELNRKRKLKEGVISVTEDKNN